MWVYNLCVAYPNTLEFCQISSGTWDVTVATLNDDYKSKDIYHTLILLSFYYVRCDTFITFGYSFFFKKNKYKC